MKNTETPMTTMYNRLFVEQLERLAQDVKDGDRTARTIVSKLNEIANAIREVNNL